MRVDPGSLDELALAPGADGREGVLIGRTSAGPFRLEILAADTVRLRIGERRGPDHGLVQPPVERPPATLARTEGGWLLESGRLRLFVETEPLAIHLRLGDRPLLGPPTDAHFRRRFRLPPFARGEEGLFAAFDLEEGEPVYGHGEKWTRLDHRGQLLVSWNEDALGVNAEASYKNVPFALSPRGWGLLTHTTARVLHGVGFAPFSHRAYALRVEEPALDLFLFAADGAAGVLDAFTRLTGRPARVPRWTLGPWLSRAYYRDEGELLAAARRCRELRLPMDVITLDGRAWQDTATRFHFAFDPARYPDPAGTVRRVHELGFALCCWEYPLVSLHGPHWRELARAGFLLKDARTGEPWRHEWDPAPFGAVLTPLPPSGIVDFTHPGARAWWRDRHAALFDLGVDVFKTDFGEQVPDDPNCIAHDGTRGPELHNVYPLLYNRCVHEASARRFGTGFVLARSGWIGSQTVPGSWGGDPQADWGGLAASIRGLLSWSLSGNPFYATDIGGFYGGPPDPELFVRWTQAAVFASHMRFHGIGPREPWAFGERVLEHVREALLLRVRLVPYIERALAEAGATGLPLCRPMPLAFPREPESWAFELQYLFGPDLLVAPIVRPGGRALVWLPEGAWVDWFTGERFTGPRRLEGTWPLERFPLFARAGAAIPLAPPTERVAAWGETAPVPIAEIRRFR
ncbi:MAG: alpha-xylosidase [Geminicoccaceae bacterium]|nr:MAG: alpha-xylosidase [Geminicoccaceae bacterium]